jgi:hypothetical protein
LDAHLYKNSRINIRPIGRFITSIPGLFAAASFSAFHFLTLFAERRHGTARNARWHIFKPKYQFGIGIFDGHLLYFTAIGYILWNLWLFRIFFPVLVCSTKRNLATLGTAPIARISSEVFPFKTIRSQSFALIFFFDNYFTQIHTITMQRTALQCTYGILKSLHPGKIRTHDLLFCSVAGDDAHYTTPHRQGKVAVLL